MITKYHIECKKGNWFVNGKKHSEQNQEEREFFNEFLKQVKIQNPSEI